MTNRVVYHKDGGDILGIYADHEIEFYLVGEECPRDRVYRFTPGDGILKFGRGFVDTTLGDSPIGDRDLWPVEEEPEDSDVMVHISFRPAEEDQEGILLTTTGRTTGLDDPELVMRIDYEHLATAVRLFDLIHSQGLRVGEKKVIYLNSEKGSLPLKCRELKGSELISVMAESVALQKLIGRNTRIVEVTFVPDIYIDN
jgi:hypothetical protein